jgi:hypothetical protein
MSPLTNLSKVVVSLAIFVLISLASATLARADTVTFNLNFPQAGWKSALECKGIRKVDCETNKSIRCESRT